MYKISHSISNLSLRPDQILSRNDMKLIVGGQDEGFPGTACLGCADSSECKAVGKGDCEYCNTHQKKCCSGWHND